MKIKIYYLIAFVLLIMMILPHFVKLSGMGGGVKVPGLLGGVCLIMLARNKNFNKSFYSTPVILWGILMLYHFINALLKDVPNTNINVFFGNVLNTTIVFGLTVFLASQNFKRTVLVLLIAYITYQLIVLSYFGVSSINFKATERLSDEESLFHANMIGQYAGFGTFLAVFLSSVYRNATKYFLVLFVFFLVFTLLTESRNALMILGIALVAFQVKYVLNSRKVGNKIYLISIAVMFSILIPYILNYTSAGSRFTAALSGEIMHVSKTYETNTIFDSLLGERVIYYVLGFGNFVDHPINGIGLWNFSSYNDFEFPLHSEYMVHLAEGGFIGFTLYLIFIGYFIKKFRKYKDRSNPLYWQLLILFIVILFIGITAREFAYNQFFPMYGLIVAFLSSSSNVFLKKNQI
ncbi:O-antigen ligase family protein [Zunongwangia sp.]|uniref:O-antigen ligase family protein n=1 Tax=Zunongwangia sp. TaxID=1965325 RepID=UPI003AA9A022